MKKRSFAILCIFVFIMSLFPLTVFAASNDGDQVTSKTETVYVNLDSKGTAYQIYVVNVFDVKSGETIYDYGNYVEVKNLTDTSEITVDGNLISAVASGDTFYYQGKLEQTELPWDISVRYFLDGSELTADEIAGKSGEFELRIDIKAGSERYKTFFEKYMVQISLTLNKDLFSNIATDNGNVNVVGRAANISYTHTWNTEAEYILRADVNDFEMGAIQFQAATIGSLELDLDDGLLDDFGDDFNALIDATGELSENADMLADGSDEFYSGILSMYVQAEELSSGVGDLYSSSSALGDGAEAFGGGLSEFSNSLAAAGEASELIAQSLEAMNQQASALPLPDTQLVAYAQTLTESNDPNLSALAASYLAQNEVIAEFLSGINEINMAYTQFNATLQAGTDVSELTSAYSQIQDGVTALNAALKQLDTSVSDNLVPGVSEMISSYAQLNDGTEKLAEAISELDTKAAEITDSFEEKADKLLESILPSELEGLSFVSEENIADSVLFIMQTNEIEAPPTVNDDAPPVSEPETFWEKLLDLFGLWQP